MFKGDQQGSDSEPDYGEIGEAESNKSEIAVVEDENWLGSSSEDEDDVLVRKERELKKQESEFLDSLGDTASPGVMVDLDAPAVNYDEVKTQAQLIVETLQNFQKMAEPGISRHEYVNRLIEDLMQLYGYNRWLLEQIYELLPTAEIIDFLDANEHQRPVVIRTNTLRTRRKELIRILNERGVNLGPLKWSKLGITIFDSQVPIGATPEYLSGYYMLQSPSSFLPVMALRPQPGHRVLDMCAAPGGKTTHMAQLMGNQGVLIANDINRERTDALVANIHRLGVTNTIVVNYNGRAFPEVMGGFNEVLIDAPCTGTGVIARDPSVKQSKNEADLRDIVKNQKELVLHAFDSVTSEGGRLCYCTCSLLVEENEGVVDYLLKHRRCKCIPTGLDDEINEELSPGITRYRGNNYDPSVVNCRRVYPHRMNMDGFFFALIDCPPGKRGPIEDSEDEAEEAQPKSEQKPKDQKKNKKQKRQKKFSKRFGGK